LEDSSEDTSEDSQKEAKPLNVFNQGIQSIDIILNSADYRESIEKIKINDNEFSGDMRPLLV
jgi:hypothetical protein